MRRLFQQRPPSPGNAGPSSSSPGNASITPVSVPHAVESGDLAPQRLHRQRLENLGILASGTAHELKNLLTPLILAVELAALEIPPAHEAQKSLAIVMAVARRARDLVQRFANYGAVGEPNRQSVALDDIAAEALSLLRPTLSNEVELRSRVAPTLPLVAADELHVHQVLTNLVINAWQALPAGRGLIEVHLEPATIYAVHCGEPMAPAPGRYVRLTVSDNGTGMDDATRARIFEEFYTTKAPRQGTGLGLSIVRNILRASRGGVTVESSPGHGSSFHVYWPLAETAPVRAFPPQS